MNLMIYQLCEIALAFDTDYPRNANSAQREKGH